MNSRITEEKEIKVPSKKQKWKHYVPKLTIGNKRKGSTQEKVKKIKN